MNSNKEQELPVWPLPQDFLDALCKVREAGGEGTILTAKGLRDAVNPIKIGTLFGMEVWADPLVEEDKWYITQDKPERFV